MSILAAERSSTRQIEAGSEELWFSGLYERTFDSAFRYANVLTHDPSLAEDIVSEVYLRAWINRGTLARNSSPTGWILTVTRNLVTDEFRSRRATVDVSVIADPPDIPVELEPELTPAQKEFIQRAIQRLTPEQQQVIFLRFFQHMSHEEVARALARKANAIRATQFRALTRLRKLLEAEGVR